jgi:hypothetical protein
MSPPVRYWPIADIDLRRRFHFRCDRPAATPVLSCDNLSVGPRSNFNKHELTRTGPVTYGNVSEAF